MMTRFNKCYDYVSTFYINSNDRAQNQLANFISYTFNNSVKGFDHLAVLTYQITGNIYTITPYNQTLVFIYSATTYYATIPVGIYTASALATAISTAMNTASSGTYTGTVTYNALLNKYVFPAVSNPLQLINLNISPVGSNTNGSIGKTIGASVTNGNAVYPASATASTFTLPYGVNLKYTSYVDACANKITYKSKATAGTSPTVKSDILVRIPTNQFNSGSEIFHYVHYPLMVEWNQDQVFGEGYFDVTLYDEWGNKLDMSEGGIDYNFMIGLFNLV